MIDIIYRYDPTSMCRWLHGSPAEARQRLCDGNRDFIRSLMCPRARTLDTHYSVRLERVRRRQKRRLGPAQQAVLRSCSAVSDALGTDELIFNQACNFALRRPRRRQCAWQRMPGKHPITPFSTWETT